MKIILTERQIKNLISGWKVSNGKLVKTYKFESYDEVIDFVNDVAKIAKKQNHHPDMIVKYDSVKLTMFDHEANDITDRCHKFTNAVDKMISKKKEIHEQKIIRPTEDLPYKTNKITPLMKELSKIFSPEVFAKEVLKQGIEHPEVAVAQAMIESGHFKSPLFQENNNVFGMKFPRQRQTTAVRQNKGQSYYKNWIDSVKDYKLWQSNMGLENLSRDEYIEKLDKIYCIPPSCANKHYSKLVRQLLGRAGSLISKSMGA